MFENINRKILNLSDHEQKSKNDLLCDQTMMGPSPQYYISSHKVIEPLLLKKLYFGVLPYIAMAATLVMWPGLCKHNFVSSPTKTSYETSTRIKAQKWPKSNEFCNE